MQFTKHNTKEIINIIKKSPLPKLYNTVLRSFANEIMCEYNIEDIIIFHKYDFIFVTYQTTTDVIFEFVFWELPWFFQHNKNPFLWYIYIHICVCMFENFFQTILFFSHPNTKIFIHVIYLVVVDLNSWLVLSVRISSQTSPCRNQCLMWCIKLWKRFTKNGCFNFGKHCIYTGRRCALFHVNATNFIYPEYTLPG